MINSSMPTQAIIEQIKLESNRFKDLPTEIGKVIVGQHHIIELIVNAILCKGHILLEGVPGVAKTTMIKAAASALGLTFNRIQFTPDLLPSDLIGTLIFNPKTHDFETKKGPIFANLILADEINRAPAKVQAALLEAMQEQQVTIGSTTYKLDAPFLVFATQNPVEQEGTYRLPEAQLDRFLFKIQVDYPTIFEELEILNRSVITSPIMQVLTKNDILESQQLTQSIYVDEKIKQYILAIVFATRKPADYKLNDLTSYIKYGVSPRATLALYNAAKTHAFLAKRHYVTPDDVKAVCKPVLEHRLHITYEAEADNVTADAIVKRIINTIPTP
ncbi:MAG TPA: MoxR family ATPase [Candidatus Babeliales bacterium]|jgi:MoxR-like ATPase|nr:MoxR family ATPase [Candidatus Babeliales bacterium]